MNIEHQNRVQVGDLFYDIDNRNTVSTGVKGQKLKKLKHRVVEIVALPSLSSQGVMRVVQAPKAPHTIGKLRRFSYAKLLSNYELVK